MRVFKGIVIIMLSLVALLYIRDFFKAKTTSTTTDYQAVTTSYSNTSMDREALAEIRKEPKVKEAIITDVGVLYASVIDDGTNRTGYAAYLCEVLRAKQATVSRVKVVKFGSTKDPNRDNAYGVLLGESWCK
jgi:hypothetical protein